MGLLFKCLLGTPQRTGDDSSPLRGEDCLDEQKEGEQKDNNQNICRENFSKETIQSLSGYIGVCFAVFPQQTFLRRLSINPANEGRSKRRNQKCKSEKETIKSIKKIKRIKAYQKEKKIKVKII